MGKYKSIESTLQNTLIVAQKIAITENYKFVSSFEISREIREGERGISGLGARGKSKIIC